MTPRTVKYSTSPVEKFGLTWRISNFADIIHSKELLNVQKCRFKMGDKIGLPTTWLCFLKVVKRDGRDWIGLYFSVDRASVPKNCKKLLARASLKISDGWFDWYYKGSFTEAKDMLTVNGWGFGRVIRQDSNVNSLPLKADGSLVVDIVMTIFNYNPILGTLQCPSTLLMTQFQVRFFEKLQKDLGTMDMGCQDYMVGIPSRELAVFMVDSRVMCARSPVLLNMAKVSKSGIVQWGIDYSTMSLATVIQFIETGKLNNDWKKEGVIEEVVQAAHALKLEDLLEFLDETLESVCTNGNAVKLMILARQLGMKKAKKRLMEYIKQTFNDDMLEQIILISKQEPIQPKEGFMEKLKNIFC